MSTETIVSELVTPEQRRWGNAILRLAGSLGKSRNEDYEKAESDDDQYGTGLPSKSIARYTRPMEPSFSEALEPGKPMLKASDWKTVMESRKVSAQDREAIINDKSSIMTKIRAWNTGGSKSQARAAAERCLKLADAPENNPEHLEIAEGLKDLETLEQKYTRPLSNEDQKKYNQDKAELLYGLQAVIFKWNNRRTSQKLPPSADAIALADMVQRVHLELITDVVESGMPMPLSFENQALSQQEKQKIQQTWSDLVGSETAAPTDGKRLQVRTPTAPYVKDGTTLIQNAGEAKAFRMQTLANLSRMMQSPGGRELLDSINKGDKTVSFGPGSSASCTRLGGGNSAFNGTGCDSRVNMVLGAKDSDVMLATENGAALFAPRFIAMGHEMVHALHN